MEANHNYYLLLDAEIILATKPEAQRIRKMFLWVFRLKFKDYRSIVIETGQMLLRVLTSESQVLFSMACLKQKTRCLRTKERGKRVISF